jgi:hypothetical protein
VTIVTLSPWNSPSKTEMLVVRYRLFVTMLLLPTTLPVPLTVMGGGATTVGGTLGLEPPRLRSPENAVISASTIGKATKKYLGRPLNDEALKREIEQAIAQAVAGKSGESVRLFEELSRKVPVPSIYNNLGVEYAKAGQTEKEARSAAGRRA